MTWNSMQLERSRNHIQNMIFWVTKDFTKMCISYSHNKIQVYFSSKIEFHIWSSYRFNAQKYFSLIWWNFFLNYILINFLLINPKFITHQAIIIEIRKVSWSSIIKSSSILNITYHYLPLLSKVNSSYIQATLLIEIQDITRQFYYGHHTPFMHKFHLNIYWFEI